MRVHVNRLLCDGNGACVIEAPEVFQLDDHDDLVLLQETPGEHLRAEVEAAVAACPKQALTLEG